MAVKKTPSIRKSLLRRLHAAGKPERNATSRSRLNRHARYLGSRDRADNSNGVVLRDAQPNIKCDTVRLYPARKTRTTPRLLCYAVPRWGGLRSPLKPDQRAFDDRPAITASENRAVAGPTLISKIGLLPDWMQVKRKPCVPSVHGTAPRSRGTDVTCRPPTSLTSRDWVESNEASQGHGAKRGSTQ